MTKRIEARASFIISEGDKVLSEVGYVPARFDTEEQARAWCHYMARLCDLIGDRDVRGTVLAIDRDDGKI